MLRVFEGPVKTKVGQGVRVNFTVTAKYGRVHPLESMIPQLEQSPNPRDQTIAEIVRAEKYVPLELEAKANEVDGGDEVAKVPPLKNEIATASVNDYQLTAAPAKPYYLDEAVAHGDPKDLEKLGGMSKKIMDELYRQRPPGGYRTRAQIEACGLDWDKACATEGLHVRIYRVK